MVGGGSCNSISLTQLQQQQGSSSSDGVVAGVFRIDTGVSSFKRLVNMLGTSEDTPSLREKLHVTKHSIKKLVEETVARLKEENETDHLSSASTGKKLKDAKLAKDFQAVLVEFQGAQKLAQSREKSFTTSMVQSFPLPPPTIANRLESTEEEVALLQQTHQVLLQVENEALYNEAATEERDQGIQEIQHQIGEVSEIFKDLAQIVANQGYMIDEIESHIESSQQPFKQIFTSPRQPRTQNLQNTGNVLFLLSLLLSFLDSFSSWQHNCLVIWLLALEHKESMISSLSSYFPILFKAKGFSPKCPLTGTLLCK